MRFLTPIIISISIFDPTSGLVTIVHIYNFLSGNLAFIKNIFCHSLMILGEMKMILKWGDTMGYLGRGEARVVPGWSTKGRSFNKISRGGSLGSPMIQHPMATLIAGDFQNDRKKVKSQLYHFHVYQDLPLFSSLYLLTSFIFASYCLVNLK